MEMVGKILGNRYEILEKIGTGGMATVYKAKCKVLNRKVAIKILKDEFANDAEFIKRFQIEAQSAASLSHQNIVSIFDVGKEGTMHYIVMELIEGKTLKEIITEKGQIPWRDSVKIAAQIASGLSQAHKNHIVHRDIKPHNILITKDGVAKVTDFGIAKAVSNSTINAFGSTIGSVHYFSPEHARGGYTDEKSDIYSLGVVLYEMTTGKLPFNAETPVSVALKHLQEQPIEPKEINSEIPDALNSIILKAMQKEVASRYASAEEFYEDLTRILKNPNDIVIKTPISANTEFPTQRIPVVGTKITKDEEESKVVKNNVEQEDEEMGKKRVSKKQGLIRFFLFMLLAVALFVGCVFLGGKISKEILGGNPNVKMIDIEGYSKEEAERMLAEIGLTMEVVGYMSSDEYPVPGFVVYQERKEGFELKKGETVKVKLSQGGEKVLVPDVSQLSSTLAAKMQIEQNGDLVYVEEYEFHDVIASGEIIRQEPKANDKVDKGSEVTVFISKGPASGDTGLVVVPQLIGKTEQEARDILDASKLLAKVEYTKSPTKTDGIVLTQTPEADEYQTELAEVVIIVNRLTDAPIEENNSGDSDNPSQKPIQPTTPGKRKVTIDLSTVGARNKFNVKVVLEGNAVGKRVEYEEFHSREDGKIEVYVTDVKNAMLKVYIDDAVEYEMTL